MTWVYEVEYHANGEVEKYKSRLVALGYSQVESIDYEDTFTLLAKITTIRTVVAMAVSYGWPMYQFDVKTAFLNGDLKEEIYVKQPSGFSVA